MGRDERINQRLLVDKMRIEDGRRWMDGWMDAGRIEYSYVYCIMNIFNNASPIFQFFKKHCEVKRILNTV